MVTRGNVVSLLIWGGGVVVCYFVPNNNEIFCFCAREKKNQQNLKPTVL